MRPDIESIRARLIAVKNQLYTDQRNFEKHCEDDMQTLLDYVAELEAAVRTYLNIPTSGNRSLLRITTGHEYAETEAQVQPGDYKRARGIFCEMAADMMDTFEDDEDGGGVR